MTILNAFTVSKENYIPGKFVDIDININQNINVHKMKPNQEEIYKYKDEQYFILSEPPGSGKSTTIKFVANSILQENPNLKVIIAVPQTLIAKTFGKVFLEYPDDSQAEWDIAHNLCESISGGRKSLNLRNFLLKKRFSNDLSDRVILVTHQTLSRLSTKIDFDNVMIIIDEGHHVLYPENGELETANQIGKIVSHLMSQNNPTIKIWFVTATFFRGDKSPIIPFDEMSKFTSYYLPLDKYWKHYIKHIQSFSYNFIIYKNNDVFNEVKEIFKTKGRRKTIIYCPYNGNLIEGSNKIQFRDKLINEIRSVWSDCRILDLIGENGRFVRKQIVIDNIVEFDIALAARLFDEGTDWPYAENAIDLYPSNSLRVQVQRFGRLLRDLPGKTHINYYVFFPFKARFKNEDDRRIHLSKNINALIASSLLYDAVEPISYLFYKTIQKKKKTDGTYQVDPFSQEVPDGSRRQEILSVVIRNLIFLKNIREKPNAQECIIKTLESFGVKNNLEEVSVHIAKILRRSVAPRNPTWDQQTIDVSWMVESGFDKVWSDNIYTGILSFTTGFCGVNTFQEFRETFDSRKIPEEWVVFAEELAKENNGILPNNSYLEKNYCGLYICIKRNRKLFQHIPRNRSYRRVREWVAIAKKLARENGGKLPRGKILQKDYGGLHRCLYEYPKLFQHIPKEKTHKSPQEWITFAKQLAKENGGILPKTSDLKKDYQYGLINCMNKHPELLKDIKQFVGRNNEIITIGEDNAT